MSRYFSKSVQDFLASLVVDRSSVHIWSYRPCLRHKDLSVSLTFAGEWSANYRALDSSLFSLKHHTFRPVTKCQCLFVPHFSFLFRAVLRTFHNDDHLSFRYLRPCYRWVISALEILVDISSSLCRHIGFIWKNANAFSDSKTLVIISASSQEFEICKWANSVKKRTVTKSWRKKKKKLTVNCN